MHCTSVRFGNFFVIPRAGLNVIDVFEASYQYPIEKVFMKPREGLSVIDLFENCSEDPERQDDMETLPPY